MMCFRVAWYSALKIVINFSSETLVTIYEMHSLIPEDGFFLFPYSLPLRGRVETLRTQLWGGGCGE